MIDLTLTEHDGPTLPDSRLSPMDWIVRDVGSEEVGIGNMATN